MGFGTIAAQIILFISLVSIAAAVVLMINQYTEETSYSLKVQKDRLVDELRTDITINSVSYNGSKTPDELLVYARNTGKTLIDLNYTDIYIDGVRVDYADRTLTIEADTEVSNPGIWDPKEVLEIDVSQDIGSGTHKARVVVFNGASDEELFST
jgi:archaellum component FlaG (FlaF/FlaG flagellin family)